MIAIGSDHGGFELKKEILSKLSQEGIDVKDFGTYKENESVDYPDFAEKVAKAVVAGEAESGIIICGTGIGISVAANKVKGIRCALCTDTYMARMAREHNDANMLAMGARVIGSGLAMEIVEMFIKSEFTGGRHAGRVNKIYKIEEDNNDGRE